MNYNTNVEVRAAFHVFPFLGKFFKLKDIKNVKIAEVNQERLEEAEYSMGTIGHWTLAIFLDEKGIELGRTDSYDSPFWRDGQKIDLKDFFANLSRKELVFQILFYSSVSRRISICRAPKTFSILSWLGELERRRLIEIEKMCASIEAKILEIDAKGNNPPLLTDNSDL